MSKEDVEKLKKRARRLYEGGQTRAGLYHDLRAMFKMEWGAAPTADWIKKVVAPDAHDAVVAIWRLMLASGEPAVSVPTAEHGPDQAAHDDVLERGLRAVLHRAQRGAQFPLVQDLVLSAAVDGVAALRVGNSADVLALAAEAKNEALAMAAAGMPFTLEALDPASVFADYDTYGMRAALVVSSMTVLEVRETWGDKRTAVLAGRTEEEQVDVWDYWDRQRRVLWVKDGEGEIINEEHGLPFIPVIREVAQGAGVWGEAQEFPLLYPLKQSGMYELESLALTMAASTTNAMGSLPYVALRKKSPAQPDPEVDWSKPGINMTLLEGQSIETVAVQAIPDALLTMMQLVERKTQEMSVPKTLLGQSPSGAQSYSALNLLTQSGRLPLVPIQQAVERALARALEIVLQWVALGGAVVTVQAGGALAALDPERIDPRAVWVEVGLEPSLPQDKLAITNAVTLAQRAGLISKKTGREWLHVEDTTGEQEQIYREQFMDKHAERFQAEAAEAGGIEVEEPQPAEPISGQGYNPSLGGLPAVLGGYQPDVDAMMPGEAQAEDQMGIER